MTIKKLSLLFLLLASMCCTAQAQPIDTQKRLKGFDQYIQKIMKDWNAPGVAVGVVVKDKLVFAKGYGYRDLENKLPVTPNTLFPIASNTKLFTSVAAGFLVEEGRFAWDKPIRQYDPSIKFYNQELDNEVTLRDMLSHRTGISRHDGIWYQSSFTRKELFNRIQYLEPSLPLRQGYLYNNLMYMGVGAVMENITGKTWEDFVRARIFQPLNMKNTFFTVDEMERQPDFAFPYYEQRDTTLLIKKPFYREMGGVGPCGSIISSVEDMSHWLIALMNKGKYENHQVIPEAVLAATLQPAMANANTNLESKGYTEIFNTVYGMGRSFTSFKGHYLTHHGGAIGGFYSQVSTLLYDGVGVIVFVNGSHNYPMVDIITRSLYDRLLGLEQTPWHERALKDYLAGKKSAKESRQKTGSDKIAGTRPSHPLEDYVGEFEHPAYGVVKIDMLAAKLRFHFNKTLLPLEHYHYDRFDTPNDQLQGLWSLNFTGNSQGEIDKVLISMDESEVSFARRADASLSDPAVLQTYIGKYEMTSGLIVEVKMPDSKTLYLQYPGQPPYELVPRAPRVFRMKQFSDTTLKFELDTGKVATVTISDPGGAATAKRK